MLCFGLSKINLICSTLFNIGISLKSPILRIWQEIRSTKQKKTHLRISWLAWSYQNQNLNIYLQFMVEDGSVCTPYQLQVAKIVLWSKLVSNIAKSYQILNFHYSKRIHRKFVLILLNFIRVYYRDNLGYLQLIWNSYLKYTLIDF